MLFAAASPVEGGGTRLHMLGRGDEVLSEPPAPPRLVPVWSLATRRLLAPSADNCRRLVCEWLKSQGFQQIEYPDHAHKLLCQVVTGGITNTLFKVTLQSAVEEDVLVRTTPQVRSFVEHGAGVRFFGKQEEIELVNRQREAAVIDYLADKRICKRTFFRFPGGQIDEWLEGEVISLKEMQESEIMGAVALQLARLHSLEASEEMRRVILAQPSSPEQPSSASASSSEDGTAAVVGDECPRRPRPHFCAARPPSRSQLLSQLYDWLSELDHSARVERDAAVNSVVKDIQASIGHFTFSQLLAIVRRIERKQLAHDEIVLCHNDLLNGNIVKTPPATKAGSSGREESAAGHVDRGGLSGKDKSHAGSMHGDEGESGSGDNTDIEGLGRSGGDHHGLPGFQRPPSPPTVEFIDFEYAAFNFAFFDVANYLNEMLGPDVELWRMPSTEVKVKFITKYLRARDLWAKCIRRQRRGSDSDCSWAGTPMSEKDCRDRESLRVWKQQDRNNAVLLDQKRVEDALRSVELLQTISHIYWGVWALAQAVTFRKAELEAQAAAPQPPTDYLLFAKRKLALGLKRTLAEQPADPKLNSAAETRPESVSCGLLTRLPQNAPTVFSSPPQTTKASPTFNITPSAAGGHKSASGAPESVRSTTTAGSGATIGESGRERGAPAKELTALQLSSAR